MVTGGVMSGLGKGLTTASLGRLLQARGLKVTAIKIDPYLNVDAGTMNPFEHGEIFVTDDGGEIDLDMGHYERFLDINLTKDHNLTTGQVYYAVISRERRGEYLGRTVQIIPHVVDEIKRRIREVAHKSGSDICLVEIGGTVGDIEGMPFLEAVRQMRLEEGPTNTLFIHVTLVPSAGAAGEQKTKPTQHSVKQLRELGISPDLIICRSREPLTAESKRKISLFCNVWENEVFSAVDVENIYELPLLLERENLSSIVLQKLGLRPGEINLTEWERMVSRMKNPSRFIKVGMVGKYVRFTDTYLSIYEALRHAAAKNGVGLEVKWVSAEQLEGGTLELLEGCQGVVIPGGFGARGAEGKILAIKWARERGVPLLGLCFGFQLAVVEFARNVVGLEGANSVEVDPSTPHPVVDLLPEQREVKELGGTMRLGAQEVVIEKGTRAFQIYGAERIFERHRHRYEVNPEYLPQLTGHGLVFSGKSPDGRRMEILEIPNHPFFLATQFHPEFKSRPLRPAPVFDAFLKACLSKSES
ncbi:MAG: CTP synthase [Candidatus Hadarchaeales archaeon]